MRVYSKIIIILILMFFAATTHAAENPDELYRQGKFPEAEEAYALLDMENPKDIRFRYNRGCAAFQNSDFQTAVASFTSVLRRTDDKKIKYKTAYNLGNTAFKQGDFKSAVNYFSQAIQHDPENEDTPYNLELALRALEKQKAKEEEDKKQQSQEDSENKGDGKDPSEDGKQDRDSKEQSDDQDKNSEEKQEKTEGDKDNKEGDNQQAEQEEPEDLSGELESSQAMPEQKEVKNLEQPGAELDRNKAEALLDNLNEDRSKFMRFQIPKDKRGGVGSGKDW